MFIIKIKLSLMKMEFENKRMSLILNYDKNYIFSFREPDNNLLNRHLKVQQKKKKKLP